MSLIFRRFLSPKLITHPSNAALLLRLRAYSEEAARWTDEKLQEAVKNDKVVVFMKGVPSQPMCGFSNAVVQILRMHGVDHYTSYNILNDEELRQKIKEFSQWPTIPQVYIGGEFVGGCDIMLQMHREGDLVEELKKVGITSALVEDGEEGKEKEDKDS